MILFWCKIALNFILSLTLKIFGYELAIVHLKIILYIAQRRIIIFNHKIGILAHDMHLLDFLLVEGIEHTIVFHLVSQLGILDTTYVHGVIQYQEPSFQFEGSYL